MNICKSHSHIQLFEAPGIVAHQVPLSRQEYWSEEPFPSLEGGVFPTQGVKPGVPALQADSLPCEPHMYYS